MEKKRYPIISKEYIAKDIVSMYIKADDIASEAAPGQFISIYSDDKSLLLPRPISICDVDRDAGTLRIVFRIVGKGTKEFAEKEAGDTLAMIGPLGNGYIKALGEESKDIFGNGESILILGGGIGIPPMLLLAKTLAEGRACEQPSTCESMDSIGHVFAENNTAIVLGYRDELFMNRDFKDYGNVYISTEDGSAGTHGNVIDCLRENDIKADVIFACGPLPMLKGIKAYAEEKGIQAWISLEEKMACGIGACLACVCETTEVDSHSMVKNKRICKDGPVFDAKEVDLS